MSPLLDSGSGSRVGTRGLVSEDRGRGGSDPEDDPREMTRWSRIPTLQ